MVKDIAKNAGDFALDKLGLGFEWVSAPWKTDDLLAAVERARAQLIALQDEYDQKLAKQQNLSSQLTAMSAKAHFLSALVTEIVEIAPPEMPNQHEADYAEATEKIYDPLGNVQLIAGGIAVVCVVPLAFVTMINVVTFGKAFKGAVSSTKLLKLAKIGKGTIIFSLAVGVLETAIKLIKANKLNDFLEEKKDTLEGYISDGLRELNKLEFSIEMAQGHLDEMLEDAGVETVREFLVNITDALAEVSEQAKRVKVARNLFDMGQPASVIAMASGLDEEKIKRIGTRLDIESLLISGMTVDTVMEEVGVPRYQVVTVKRVLAVRGDAALGLSDDELVEMHQVTDAVADMQIGIAEEVLKPHWDAQCGTGDLAVISKESRIPKESLIALRLLLPVKAALWAEQSVEEVKARFPEVDGVRIDAMFSELKAQKAMFAKRPEAALEYAVAFRLPRSALSGT